MQFRISEGMETEAGGGMEGIVLGIRVGAGKSEQGNTDGKSDSI